MSNSRVYRALNPDVHARAGGLFGGGLLGDPFSDLPVLGGLSSALSPIFTPIGLPGPKSSTTATTTSARTTSTIVLTTSSTSLSAASTSATSTSASVTASATSVASATSSSTTDTATSASTQQVSDATLTPTPTPSNTVAAGVSLSSGSTSSSASASVTAVADTANTPKGFLANKALSVGVITAASLVGLVLIIAIATWAIRKRKNDRIHQDILDFSTGNLMNDTEKGAGAGGSGSIEGGSSTGHGSSSSHGTLSLGPMQPRGIYESNGYHAAPVYAPKPTPSRMANPYPAQQQYMDRTYAFPSQEQNTTYANWNYGYGNGAAMQQPQNQFDQAYSGVDDAYGGLAYDAPQQPGAIAMAGVGAGAQSQGPQRRPSAHRKPPPQLYIAPPNPIAEATNAPSPALQAPAGLGAAQPARRSSLLNSPVVEGEVPRERKDTLTHVELLDPSAPKVPAASPRLPDEFGMGAPPASKDSPAEQPVRRLVVRNE